MSRGVGIRHVVTTAVIVFAPCYVVLRLLTSRGHAAPTNSWWSLGVLLLIAGLLLVAGLRVRSYLAGRAVRTLEPERARRTLVGGQAGALGGAAMFGWYAAQAGIHARHLDLDRSRAALVLTVALALGAAALSGSGLLVQRWCRIDDDQAGTAHTTQLPEK